MSRTNIGRQYDEIAIWWAERQQTSNYGVEAVKTALRMAKQGGNALDVGCGAGGRLVKLLEDHSKTVTGIDASQKMIELARTAHPQGTFISADIRDWTADRTFDFVLSWDCLFHLPFDHQEGVLSKLCDMLADGGVLIYSFGDDVGSHSDEWLGQIFHYSSLGVTRNVEILHDKGLVLRHLELDQFPEKHVYLVAQKAG